MNNRKKVLVGMSGGVDSSVTALLLQQQGFEVIGAFMKNWSEDDDSAECSWRAERRDAIRVAAQLDIPLHTFDYEKEYRAEVYEYMIREYQAGRTPNPDVLCNKYMKFGYLLREADKLGCEFFATGHYARVEKDSVGVAHLYAGVDDNKDQSYFLCQLEQPVLQKALFPIGHLPKPKVREIAREFNLPVADKKDSQGICFVGKVAMQSFLEQRIPPHPGNIVTTSGEILGKHKGYAYYTIGQRSGLGIGGGIPYFVVERRPETNEVVVALGEDDSALLSRTVHATDFTETIPGGLAALDGQITARVRYRQPLQSCRIEINGSEIVTHFDKDQKAVAPGQFIAWYRGEELLGSGIINRTDK
jgi:tRNA-specific 2-thiouridylase